MAIWIVFCTVSGNMNFFLTFLMNFLQFDLRISCKFRACFGLMAKFMQFSRFILLKLSKLNKMLAKKSGDFYSFDVFSNDF